MTIVRTGALVAAAGWPALALAHHPRGGEAPAGALDGLLSGFAHPLLGIDHALLLAAIALLGAHRRCALALVSVWISAMCVGAGAATFAGVTPDLGWAIAATLVAATALLMLAGRVDILLLLGSVACAGIVHGLALGEMIVGADRPAALSYLIGLALVQIAVGTAITRSVIATRTRMKTAIRWLTGIACMAAAMAQGAVG